VTDGKKENRYKLIYRIVKSRQSDQGIKIVVGVSFTVSVAKVHSDNLVHNPIDIKMKLK